MTSYRTEPSIAKGNSANSTTAYANTPALDSARQQAVFVPGGGSTPHFTHEINCLLRRRLRVAGLIGLFGFSVYLIRAFILASNGMAPPAIGLALHSVVVAVLIGAACLLWSHVALDMAALRWIEVGMFGAMAAFFAYLHFAVFYHEHVLDTVASDEGKVILFAAVNLGNCLRWFILIVLYGTFIPNTWRRCATIVGGMALTPVALSIYIGFQCPILGAYVWHGMFEMVVTLAIASTIAIFGSYKIGELQQQAFAARKLGQYVLSRRLGAGGMGEVYLGEHTMLRRACAIKLIRPDQAGDPTTLSRFEREVQAMANLTHWNTVEVYDYGIAEDGTFYYVMEYLPGLSLQELVERHGPLSPSRAVYILRQVCAALKEAHSIGLIHRDIKPSNVILCERGGVHDVAKLLDFGLVQGIGFQSDTDKLTLQGTILGSPPYMSPEQALSKGEIDFRTDIYSLGGLAYFLLTGQPPFERETAMEMLMAHVHDRPTAPREIRPELSPDLEALILRCLAKKPDERFPNIHRVDRALAECAAADWDSERAREWWQESESEAKELTPA